MFRTMMIIILMARLVCQDENEQRVLGRFNNWVNTKLDLKVKKVHVIYMNDLHRFGVVANDDIRRGETYLEININSTIGDHLIYQSKLGQYLLELEKGIPYLRNNNQLNLLFYLILEKNNPESFWKPYFDILPIDFQHLPMMNQ